MYPIYIHRELHYIDSHSYDFKLDLRIVIFYLWLYQINPSVSKKFELKIMSKNKSKIMSRKTLIYCFNDRKLFDVMFNYYSVVVILNKSFNFVINAETIYFHALSMIE